MAALDLTHVLYDESSYVSLFLALITLSPILLMASYAALAVQTREYIILIMWIGQFAGEGLNWIIKRIVKEGRPIEELGSGYGFPSSHSQYMGYFGGYLVCHLWFTHRFVGMLRLGVVDVVWRFCVYLGLVGWSLGVCYSRYRLGYHTVWQVVWGLGIGVVLGVGVYGGAVVVPRWYPGSVFGCVKRWVVGNPVSTWFRIRDGWEIWGDGGREAEWLRWKEEWDHSNANCIKRSRAPNMKSS